MANSKVSALTALAVQPADTDEFYINDGGVSKKIAWSTIKAVFATAAQGTLADSAVQAADYDANTILAATSDDTPAALTVAEQTLVGRITAGNIDALTATEVRTLLNVADGAIAEVASDTTPTLGGPLDGDGNDLNNLGVLFLTEQAAAESDVTGKGQFWVKTATPNEPWFTDDAGNDFNLQKPTEFIAIAVSDETTALTTGTAKVTFRMPYAFTLTEVRCSVTTAPTGANLIVDINEGGSTLMTTNKLSIDATEKTSTTATTAAGLTDTALADDAEITIDIDQIGSSVAGAGLKVVLIGKRT